MTQQHDEHRGDPARLEHGQDRAVIGEDLVRLSVDPREHVRAIDHQVRMDRVSVVELIRLGHEQDVVAGPAQVGERAALRSA